MSYWSNLERLASMPCRDVQYEIYHVNMSTFNLNRLCRTLTLKKPKQTEKKPPFLPSTFSISVNILKLSFLLEKLVYSKMGAQICPFKNKGTQYTHWAKVEAVVSQLQNSPVSLNTFLTRADRCRYFSTVFNMFSRSVSLFFFPLPSSPAGKSPIAVGPAVSLTRL